MTLALGKSIFPELSSTDQRSNRLISRRAEHDRISQLAEMIVEALNAFLFVFAPDRIQDQAMLLFGSNEVVKFDASSRDLSMKEGNMGTLIEHSQATIVGGRDQHLVK